MGTYTPPPVSIGGALTAHTTAVIILLSLFCASRPARAERPKLLLDAPPRIHDAAETALHSWIVEAVELGLPPSQETVDVGIADAAAGRRAQVVAWLDCESDPATLWVYDVPRNMVLERALATRPPFDDASAASVALSLKTLLRHRRLLQGRPLPLDTLVEDEMSEAYPATLGLALGLGTRAAPSTPAHTRMQATLIWALGRTPYAMAARLDVGSQESVQGPGFPVGLWDMELAAELRRAFAVPLSFQAEAIVRAGIHRSALTGIPGARQPLIDEVHINPVVGVGGRLRHRLFGRIHGEFGIDGHYMGARQRYTTPDGTVLSSPRVALQVGFALYVALTRPR